MKTKKSLAPDLHFDYNEKTVSIIRKCDDDGFVMPPSILTFNSEQESLFWDEIGKILKKFPELDDSNEIIAAMYFWKDIQTGDENDSTKSL